MGAIRHLKKTIKTNTLNFKALDIATTDPYNQLRDDGFVEHIEEHYKKLLKEFGVSREYKKIAEQIESLNHFALGGYKLTSMTSKIRDDKRCLWVIYAINLGDDAGNLAAKAHEETNVLNGIGKLNLLEKKIKVVIPNFQFKDSNNQYIAGIGECYALNSRKIPLSKITNIGHQKVQEAFKYYQRLLEGK